LLVVKAAPPPSRTDVKADLERIGSIATPLELKS
jgi:hypothetical protein